MADSSEKPSWFRRLVRRRRKGATLKKPKPEKIKISRDKKSLNVERLTTSINYAAATALKLDTAEGDGLCKQLYISNFCIAMYASQMEVAKFEDLRVDEFAHVGEVWKILQACFDKLNNEIPPKTKDEQVLSAINNIHLEPEEPGFEGFKGLVSSLDRFVELLRGCLFTSMALNSNANANLDEVPLDIPYTDERNMLLNPLSDLYTVSHQGLVEVRFDLQTEKSLENLLQNLATDAFYKFEQFLRKDLFVGNLGFDAAFNWNYLIHRTGKTVRNQLVQTITGIAISLLQILEQIQEECRSPDRSGAYFTMFISDINDAMRRNGIDPASHVYQRDPKRYPVRALSASVLFKKQDDFTARRTLGVGRTFLLLSSICDDMDDIHRELLAPAEEFRGAYEREKEIAKSFLQFDEKVGPNEDEANRSQKGEVQRGEVLEYNEKIASQPDESRVDLLDDQTAESSYSS